MPNESYFRQYLLHFPSPVLTVSGSMGIISAVTAPQMSL